MQRLFGEPDIGEERAAALADPISGLFSPVLDFTQHSPRVIVHRIESKHFLQLRNRRLVFALVGHRQRPN
jgi:hypothetical protein